MKIAILGTRGIPANYGGFETFAEELSARLVVRGHSVVVYCRSHYVSSQLKWHRGVRLVVLPTISTKHLDTVVHALASCLHALTSDYDVVLLCNAANSFCCGLLALRRIPVVINVDGIERERKKWGRVGQFYYQLSEKLAVRWASCLVSDAQVIREYYLFWHHHDSVFIPYGFTLSSQLDLGILNEFGVQIRQYFLYVSRLEPENHAEVVIRAHALAGSSWPLLIVGTAPYARKYIQMLEGIAGPSVIFCGAVYGGRYHALQAHAFAYIQATEVGGTHPALVEAMGYGNLILANDTPENREVLGQTGFFYRRNDAADLARLMQQAARESGLRERLGHQARERARQNYDWEQVTEQYEQVFYSLIHTVASSTLPA